MYDNSFVWVCKKLCFVFVHSLRYFYFNLISKLLLSQRLTKLINSDFVLVVVVETRGDENIFCEQCKELREPGTSCHHRIKIISGIKIFTRVSIFISFDLYRYL